jgi:hypothetical protein
LAEREDIEEGNRPHAIESPIMNIRWGVLIGWGFILRTALIFIIAYGSHNWYFAPVSISDKALSELTLGEIGTNISSLVVSLFCIYWFFNFPENKKSSSLKESPYVAWASQGSSTIFAICGVIFLIVSFLS